VRTWKQGLETDWQFCTCFDLMKLSLPLWFVLTNVRVNFYLSLFSSMNNFFLSTMEMVQNCLTFLDLGNWPKRAECGHHPGGGHCPDGGHCPGCGLLRYRMDPVEWDSGHGAGWRFPTLSCCPMESKGTDTRVIILKTQEREREWIAF
jgi:hypothetical protein